MAQITRRQFASFTMKSALLSAVPISGLLLPGSARAQSAAYVRRAAKLVERSPDDWLDQMKREKRLQKPLDGPLDLRRFKDPVYVLLGPIGWKPKADVTGIAPLVVPRGFVTDLASVPRVFWSLFRPDGSYAYAAVLHDYLYWQQDRTIDEANTIFRFAMTDLKINDFQKATLFQAVDKFGPSSWAANRQLKSEGERRVLSVLPGDPTLTWKEYKTHSNVFLES